MSNDCIKEIQKISFFIEGIARGTALLQNSEKLFIVSDHSIQTGNYHEAIKIPECLINDFKKDLMAYLVNSYNNYVKELKEIEL